MTLNSIHRLLASRVTEAAARILLTFPFWGSGIHKLLNFANAKAEMAHFGLEPASAFAAATIITQLGGSALVISRKLVWLGAGALGVFTALTIPIVHSFWRLDGEAKIHAMHTAGEHVGIIAGLILIAIIALSPSGEGFRSGERKVGGQRP